MTHAAWKHMGTRMNYMGMRMSGATISMAEWGCPSSWGQHASTIMQSVMTAEERGYPMEKELFDYVTERAEVLAINDASTQVTKDAAAAWEAAVAADASDEAVAAATDKLLDVLEGRPTTIDGVIAFAEGPRQAAHGRGGRCGNVRPSSSSARRPARSIATALRALRQASCLRSSVASSCSSLAAQGSRQQGSAVTA